MRSSSRSIRISLTRWLPTNDEDLIEAALARPRNKWNNAADVGIATLAAAYAFGWAKNHGFIDGNKRSAFIMAAYSFLGLNGLDFAAAEADVVETMERLAAGKLSEKQLAAWFQRGLK